MRPAWAFAPTAAPVLVQVEDGHGHGGVPRAGDDLVGQVEELSPELLGEGVAKRGVLLGQLVEEVEGRLEVEP